MRSRCHEPRAEARPRPFGGVSSRWGSGARECATLLAVPQVITGRIATTALRQDAKSSSSKLDEYGVARTRKAGDADDDGDA